MPPMLSSTPSRSLVPNPTNSRARARDLQDLARLGINAIIYVTFFRCPAPLPHRYDITDDKVIAFARRPYLGSTYNTAVERFGLA